MSIYVVDLFKPQMLSFSVDHWIPKISRKRKECWSHTHMYKAFSQAIHVRSASRRMTISMDAQVHRIWSINNTFYPCPAKPTMQSNLPKKGQAFKDPQGSSPTFWIDNGSMHPYIYLCPVWICFILEKQSRSNVQRSYECCMVDERSQGTISISTSIYFSIRMMR